MNAHTPRALRAAKIIMNEKGKINTDYGQKTLEGIADLIEREIGLPELLEACKWMAALLDTLDAHHAHQGIVSNALTKEGRQLWTFAKNAIAKAEGM